MTDQISTVATWIQAISALAQAGGAIAVVFLTISLIRLTRKSVAANQQMAESIHREFSERYRPSAELETEIVWRDAWLYDLEISVANKGITPLRLDRISASCGTHALVEQRDVVVAVGETRRMPSKRFSLHDLAGQSIREGQIVTIVVEVQYRELDGSPRVLRREPWTEYRERQRDGGWGKDRRS